jgi:fatty acid amide hydrolase
MINIVGEMRPTELSASELIVAMAKHEISPLPLGDTAAEQRIREAITGSVGLPMSVQVVARPWRDHEALAAMSVIEAASRASGEHPGRPPLD